MRCRWGLYALMLLPLVSAMGRADDEPPPPPGQGPPPGERPERRPPRNVDVDIRVEEKGEPHGQDGRRGEGRRRGPGRPDDERPGEFRKFRGDGRERFELRIGPRDDAPGLDVFRDAVPTPEEIEQIVRSAIRDALQRRLGPDRGPLPPPPPGDRPLFGPSKELRELHQQDFKLDQEAHQLGEKYRKTQEAGDKEKIKAELKSVVEKHFELRQKRRTLELEQLAKQLDQLKSAMEKRQKNRDALIAKRVAELTGEDDSGF